MISYTPNLEDVLLERCFRDVNAGFYIDIGAHHPTNASVTRWFYDRGWFGINVEPGEGIAALRAQRPRDVNIEAAVADFEGRTTFFVHTGNTGTSTLSPDPAQVVAEKAGVIESHEVEVTTLSRIIDRHAAGKLINFLKIDAEGAENAIIRSTDWSAYRPEIIVIESTEPYTNIRRVEDWQGILARSGYEMVYFDGVNDFWLRRESFELSRHFTVPVNVLDYFEMYSLEKESLRSQLITTRTEVRKLRQQLREAAVQAPSTASDVGSNPQERIAPQRVSLFDRLLDVFQKR